MDEAGEKKTTGTKSIVSVSPSLLHVLSELLSCLSAGVPDTFSIPLSRLSKSPDFRYLTRPSSHLYSLPTFHLPQIEYESSFRFPRVWNRETGL